MKIDEILREDVVSHPTITDNPRFLEWFGDSKVVDSQGDPLVLFHGTAYDFDAFETPTFWASADPKLASLYAEQRPEWDNLPDKMGSHVMPVFMRIENPFNADTLEHTATIDKFLKAVIIQARQNGIDINQHEHLLYETLELLVVGQRREESGPVYSVHDFWYKPEWSFGKDASDALRRLFFSLGFDGIFYSEMGPTEAPDVPTWGTFHKQNVKSAIGNVSYSASPSMVESTINNT